jgi:anti-anti-sigma factor
MAEFIVTRANGVSIVDFAEKESLDIEKSKAIGRKLREIVDSGEVANLLIDFRFVTLITSSTVAELLQLRKKCSESHVRLKFCTLSHDLADLLKKLKLDKSFEIYPSRDPAVKAFETTKDNPRSH